MNVEFSITPGSRKNCTLVYTNADRQLFQFRSKIENGAKYSCYYENCRARIQIINNICSYVNDVHTHGHQENEMLKFKLQAAIKKRCEEENARPRDIFNQECSLHPEAAEKIQFGEMRRSLNNCKRKGIPKNPLTIEEVEAFLVNPIVNAKLLVNAQNFYKCTVIKETFAFVIFANEEILANLPALQKFLIDGTFKVVPAGPFNSLVTISIEEQQHLFPVFYVLTTRRTEESYDYLFKYIADHWQLNPKKFMCDYERAMRNALRKQFPGVSVKGCWFHYCHAIRRYAAKIPGCFDEIWRSETKKQFFHKLLVLPLLQENKIVEAFEMLKQEVENVNFENPFKIFLTYFERQWIRREGPHNICVYKELNRTNNLSESYNSNLKCIMKIHGNLFDFVAVLIKEKQRISREYRVLRSGGDRIFSDRRKKYATRDAHIKLVQNRFEDDLIDMQTFFNQLTFVDNTGSISLMDRYEDGDENDVEDDDNDDAELAVEEEGAVGGAESTVGAEQAAVSAQIVALRSQIETLRNESLCVICQTNERNTVLRPCRHGHTCTSCTDILLSVRYDEDGNYIIPACPICRSHIETSEIAFF